MNNCFAKIECGEGNRPLCKFWLNEPINAGGVGNVNRIDVGLSEDGSRFDVWVVSEENGRLFYKLVAKKMPSEVAQRMEECISQALELAKQETLKNREANYAPTQMLRESVRKIVAEHVRKQLS